MRRGLDLVVSRPTRLTPWPFFVPFSQKTPAAQATSPAREQELGWFRDRVEAARRAAKAVAARIRYEAEQARLALERLRRIRDLEEARRRFAYETSLGRIWGDKNVWDAERYVNEAKQKLEEIKANGNKNGVGRYPHWFWTEEMDDFDRVYEVRFVSMHCRPPLRHESDTLKTDVICCPSQLVDSAYAEIKRAVNNYKGALLLVSRDGSLWW
jgi:hypothetical protein